MKGDTVQSVQEELTDAIQSLRIIDTHEHVSSPHVVKKTKRSLLDFIMSLYIRDDLESSGMRSSLGEPDSGKQEKWRELAGYLSRIRNTTYYHVLQTIFQDLFGVNGEFLEKDYDALSPLVEAAAAKGEQWYDFVLKDKSNIEMCFIDKGQTTDFEVKMYQSIFPDIHYVKESPERSGYKPFLPVLRIDMFARAFKEGAPEAVEEKFGFRVETFDEFEAFLKKMMAGLRKSGFVAIKSTLAYFGDIDHSHPDRERAKKAWGRKEEADKEDQICFRDYVVWLLSDLAAENGLTFQIHTGTLCWGAPYREKIGPQELLSLICAKANTKFDLFHAGFPFSEQAGAMVKNLKNAYLNMNWLPVLSQSMAQRYLGEILDLVPMNKITWGGDSVCIEEIYAHTKLMKEILVSVLSERCERHRYDLPLCKDIARRILRENGIELYGLPLIDS